MSFPHSLLVRFSEMRQGAGARAWRTLWVLCLVAVLSPARAAQFTEPDIIFFGKVLNLHGGGAHQLYGGTLTFSIVSSDYPDRPLNVTTQLRPVGSANEYSYRFAIKVFVDPNLQEKALGLTINRNVQNLSLINPRLDGSPVTLADLAQVQNLIFAAANRGKEYGVDLLVSIPEPDSDEDGMADWWEDLHGLDKYSAADAARDKDGDGLTNLQEYQKGTNPEVPNTTPLLLGTRFPVPVGGTSGLALSLVAQGASPSDLFLSVAGAVEGLTWRMDGAALPAGGEFPYQAVLEGRVSVAVSPSFTSGIVPLSCRNATPGASTNPALFKLQFNGISPGRGLASKPSLWLMGDSFQPGGDWRDLSGQGRDAYQPSASAEPAADAAGGSVRFTPPRFLYVDDRQWAPSGFTAVLAFGLDSGGGARQTLFNHSRFEISVASEGADQRSVSVREPGRTTTSPILRQPGGIVTLHSAADAAWLDVADQGRSFSAATAGGPPSAFTTLGAARTLSAPAPTNFLNGTLQEVVFFDALLAPKGVSRLQDYLLSRWQDVLIWDYRDSAGPVQIVGSSRQRNSISGGFADDTLQGGSRADILRGGPGNNLLRGGGGGDRFVFEPNQSRDTIEGFSPEAGDVLDLNGVFTDARGLPPAFVNIRSVVTRGADRMPHVDSIIELSYSGKAGSAVDQTITLKDVAIGNSDLESWVGQGILQLGGLSYGSPQTVLQIVRAPSSQSVYAGQSVRFEVQAASDAPLAFQWLFNGVPLSGANQSSLDLVGVSTAQAGGYSVVVSNRGGRLTSPVATLAVSRSTQSIRFEPLPEVRATNGPILLLATASSGLPVTFGAVSGPAQLSGNTLSLTGVGVVTVQASQAGNGAYEAATPVTQAFVVVRAPQGIDFAPPVGLVEGDPPVALQATASSGLPVHLVSSDESVVAVLGRQAFIRGPGSVTLTAVQEGNPTYEAATNASPVLTVAPLVTQLSIRRGESNQTVLTVTGNINRQYGIQYLPDLSQTNWQTLTTISNLPAASHPVTVPTTNSARIFRLVRPVWRP